MPGKARKTAGDVVGEGDVELVLAHPLRAARAKEILVDAPDEDLEVGQRIRTDRQRGRQFINSGAVKIDPEDREAVRAALKLDDVRQATVPEGSFTG